MRDFVTGATGLLGSHLLYFLAASGHEVLALRRKQSRLEEVRAVFRQYPDGDECWNAVAWIEGDVLEPECLAACISNARVVYHCAAVVSFVGADRERLSDTNLQGTEHVASLCLEHRKRLCYVSSIAALGDASYPGEVIDEETPVIEGREHSVYSHSKAVAEQIVWKYVARGLDAVLVCPAVILGAGMWGRSSARLFLTAIRGMSFYTEGGTGYVDVRDVCRLMIRLCEDPAVSGERFVLNGGNYTYRTFFSAVAKVHGIRPPRWKLTPWMTAFLWRLAAGWSAVCGSKPLFTRELARTSQHRSYYSSAKLLRLYPDFHFSSLEETLAHIQRMWERK